MINIDNKQEVNNAMNQVKSDDKLFAEYTKRMNEMAKSGDSQRLREVYSLTILSNMHSDGLIK